MRISRMGATGALVAAAALALPATSLAAKPVTFKGKTSQGKSILVQYVKTGAHTGVIRFKTNVAGVCPVRGFGTNATMSTQVADQAHGGWPIPSRWGWETKKPTYDIKVKAQGRRSLSGKLLVSWQTNIDNAPTCTTPLISFTVKR
jgi:hypothetical protein